MSIRGPYLQGPNLAAPHFYRPHAADYPNQYYSPSISSSSSSTSDLSSASSSSYSPATPEHPATHYSTIPANFFEASKRHSSSSAHPPSRSTLPPRTSSHRTADRAHIEQQRSRGGDRRERSQRGVEHHQVEDDEVLAWRIHEEEISALESQAVYLQQERDLQRALEESRQMAVLESRRSDKINQSHSSRAGHEQSQRAAPIVRPVSRQGASIPPTSQSRSRQAASASQQRQASSSRIAPASHAHPLLGYRSLFMGGQTCSQCDETIPVFERNRGSTLHHGLRGSLGPLLHMTCPSCSATQCRGCSRPAACPRRCTGGQQCTLVACCSEVRAIAIFEVLVDFDKAFADKVAELHANSQPQHVLKIDREVYLDLATSWADIRVSEPLKNILTTVLSKLTHWLAGDLHALTALLISTSHLLEVIQAFLSVPNAGDWLRRRALYGQILDFLRYLATRHSLHALVMGPRQDIQRTCGLQSIMVSATYLEDAAPTPSRSLYEIAISGPSLKEMERYACRAHHPELGHEAQVLWQSLKYLELVKALGSDTD